MLRRLVLNGICLGVRKDLKGIYLDVWKDLKGDIFRCLEGFEGDNCDRCSSGFYRFPNCRACNCITAGTDPSACR